jgi:hypothetical protein
MFKLLRFLFLLAVISFSHSASSQCAFNNTNFPEGILTPNSASWSVASTAIYAGEYSQYNVTIGNTYEWSTCPLYGGLSSYDSQLTLWRSTNTLTPLASADDECGDGNALLTWTATFSGVVYVQVNEWNCLTNSTFTTLVYRRSVAVGGAPANDLCANATTINLQTNCTPIFGTVLNATGTTPTGCVGTANDDVWYRLVSNGTGDIDYTVTPNGVGLDPVVEIFFGTSCSALTSFGCLDDLGDGGLENGGITGVTAGDVIWLRVYDFFSAAAANPSFTFCAEQAPALGIPGDDCANATQLTNNLTCQPVAGNLGNFSATTNPVQACGGTLSTDAWYTFTASADSVLFSFAPTGSMDLVVEIYEGNSCGEMAFLGCADFTLSGEAETIIINNTLPGTRFYVRVYDYFGNANSLNDLGFTACVFTDNSGGPVPPTNDNCDGAIPIVAGTACNTIAGTMLNATASLPATGCGGTNSEDVWYEIFASDTAVTVEIFPDFATLGLVAEVFVSTTPGSCTNLISIGCADFGLAGQPEAFQVNGMAPGESIFVRIYDFPTAPPANPGFTICAYWDPQSLTPSNDECAGATPLAVNSSCNPINGTTLNATGSAPASSCSPGGVVEADVWYSFVATATSVNIIVDPTADMDPVIQYFSGSCANLTSRGCSDFFAESGSEQLAASGLTIGQTYYIRVYDYRGLIAPSTTFTICVQNNVVPTNDNCLGAIPIPVSGGIVWTPADNALASQSQVGCTGNANDDVWFSFVAGSNPAGTTLYIYGDLDYQTVFQVFSGTCSNLTSIICENTDITGPYYSQTASLTNLTPGQTYFVRVYNFDASTTNSTFYVAAVGTPVGCNLTAPIVSTPSSSVICSGGSIDLTATFVNGLTYQWQLNGINIPGATGSSINNANAPGNYSVFVTDAQGCTATSNAVSISVGQAPTVAITAGGSTTICGTGSVSLSTAAQSGSTYQWLNNGSPIGGATGISYSATASGNYSLRITNAAGCEGFSNSISVSVVAAITATIANSGNNTICQGSSSILNVNTQVGNSIQWRLNGNPINGATSVSYTATQAGAYTAFVTNGPSCNATSNSITLTIVAGPNASISAAGSTTFCQGSNVTLNVGNVAGASFQWLQNGSLILGESGTSYSATESGSYTALVTTAACAATSNAINVTVNSSPSSSIFANGPTTFCQGNSVVLNAPSGSGLSYQWFNNGNAIAGATSASYTASVSGNYVVSLTQNGCSGNSPATTVTVTAPPSSNITVNGNATVCQGNNVLLSGPTAGNVSYQWSLNGSPIQGAVGLNYTASTSGNYTLTVSQGTSCSSTSNATSVNILAAPVATLTAAGPTGICQGGSVVLNASTGNGYTYQWQINGATIPGTTGSSYSANSAGDYTVVITNTSACTSTSAAVTVTVNPQPSATITANGPTTFCVGGTVLLQANSGNGFTYQWQQNGNPLPGVVNSVFNVSTSGNYTVVVTNQSNCSAVSAPIQVNVAGVVASITFIGDPAICDGNAVVLNANQTAGLQYQWQNNGSNIPNETSATYTATAGGNFTVTVTDLNNCSSTSNPVNISVGQTPPTPVVTAGGPTAFCEGSSLTLTYSASVGLTYSWTSFGTPVIGGTNGSLEVTSAGEYVLTASNSANCSASASPVAVTVNPLPVVSLTLNPDTICSKGAVLTLVGGSPAGGTYSGTGVSSGSFTSPELPGNVVITYTFSDVNGCSNSANDVIKVVECTGINELETPQLSLFPNPASDVVTLTTNFSLRNSKFELMDATGRRIQIDMLSIGENSLKLSIDGLATGVYQLVIRQGDNVYTVKLVKTV